MADRARLSVPIVRSGILAQEFCATCAWAEVAAVYVRSLYLRAGDSFVCIGEPVVGNGPSTLIVVFRLSELGLRPGASVTIADRKIAIGSIAFTLDRCALWRPPGWPVPPSRDHLADTCAALARRLALEASREELGFPDSSCPALCRASTSFVSNQIKDVDGRDKPGHDDPVKSAQRSSGIGRGLLAKRIARFEAWLSNNGDTAEAVHGLVGLGPGLTPSGDDILIGALAMLDALKERDAHAALARAVDAIAPGLTSPLSHCFLRAAAAGHIGERFHTIVASVVASDIDRAIATARTIGHSSGWDMLTGALIALRSVTTHRG